MANIVEKRITAFKPIFLRSSCSGSAAQFKKVTTSLAIWEVVAGVPVRVRQSIAEYTRQQHTIVILDKTVKQHTSHGNSTTGEVGVIVHAIPNLNTRRRVHVTGQERKHVVLHHMQTKHQKQREWGAQLTAPLCLALMIKLRSGGRAPLLLARAASSLGYGAGR